MGRATVPEGHLTAEMVEGVSIRAYRRGSVQSGGRSKTRAEGVCQAGCNGAAESTGDELMN
jgi:hypothetical protein